MASDGRAIPLDVLEQFVQLKQSVDSIELKATIPESQHRAATTGLDVDVLDAQIRQVFFFDTPQLDLDRAGVVLRARRVQAKGDDTVVKLRPVVPDDLPNELRQSPNMGVEIDVMPGGFVCSASMKGNPTTVSVKEAVSGKAPLRKIFSKEQRAFFTAHAPEGIDVDTLSVLGPITVFKLNWVPEDFGRKLVGEMWLYPDYSRIVELSTKCAPAETLEVAFSVRRFLQDKGIDLGSEQQTKTRTALEFFAKQLAAEPSART
jgi:hypothetical protein